MSDTVTTRVEIDLNVRCGVNQTYAGFEDVTGELPQVGQIVEVAESESGLSGSGRVLDVRVEQRILVLEVVFADLSLPLPIGRVLQFRPLTAPGVTETRRFDTEAVAL